MEKYMKIALKEAEKAYKKNEVPIGAVIVKDGKIIAKAHNKKEIKNISTCHAEILAINKACKKLKNWRLLDCTLYITVEPCLMCCGAIIQSRINTVVYGTTNENYGAIKSTCQSLSKYNVKIVDNICHDECENIMKLFFKNKRKSL